MSELSGPKCYQIKMYKLGDIYEIYKYELPVYVGYHKLLAINKSKPIDNVGAYIIKYMNKNIIDERLMGKKAYFISS